MGPANTQLRRRITVVLGGAALAALVLTTTVSAERSNTRTPSSSLVRHADGPITELGGGGETPPLQALNDVWGLSRLRSTCTMCHNLRPTEMNVVDATWAQRQVLFNGFGAMYRDVLFKRVAPAYDDIYSVPLQLKKAAARWPALRTTDSDGDGYSNELELTFGSKPGVRASRPWRPAALLERWLAIIVRETIGTPLRKLEVDSRLRRVGVDTDGDRVPDVLEHFVGSDSRDRKSTPLVAARRLAVYRQLLLNAGVPVS